ncbi:cytochrome P450 [Psychromarinibacter sp. C21-152]|uniref:Cytochrome P450 n=1 Tax=Psychromarinibacter sediminicola TaxID=3033385 RepID=A0AAE3T969_9RHOB|nr:cytochrome P450 [Psychromarinibacter sediminicola]MDF0601538.1 cytochrome P450 [Psychromarinibacter sediminicola]
MAHYGPAELAHIPGPRPDPLLGHTLKIMRDCYGFTLAAREAHGDIYKTKLIGQWRVLLHGADALEFVLIDRDRNFSNQEGWLPLRNLFDGGLLMRDFDEHRRHRRIMQAAFRSKAMEEYVARMNAELPRLLAEWPVGKRFAFYPAVKELTLRLGASVFMGMDPDDPRVPALNKAFVDEIAATYGLVRKPVPLTKMWHGIRGRRYLIQTFKELIAERRDGGGEDFFSQMCRATDDDGDRWTEEEIVDHFNFLLMAAHDTTASGLATMAWALTTWPDWQERIIAEVDALPEGPLDDAALNAMPVTERAFKEALRLVPPVPFIPRRTVRDVEWQGVTLPKGTHVSVCPGIVQLQPDLWTDPDSFDPDRFSPNRAEDRRHKFAWSPFGGGAHKCLGMHFAMVQVKLFTAHLLRHRRMQSATDAPATWQMVPIPWPKGGLPIVLEPRRETAAAPAKEDAVA